MADETMQTHGASCTCDACMDKDERKWTVWHDGEPRAIIRHFAAAMERKLAANDAHKGGWHRNTTDDLFRALREEVRELFNAVESCAWWSGTDEAKQDVLQEAADVANYAMLIADVVGALPPTDERGR